MVLCGLVIDQRGELLRAVVGFAGCFTGTAWERTPWHATKCGVGGVQNGPVRKDDVATGVRGAPFASRRSRFGSIERETGSAGQPPDSSLASAPALSSTA